MKAERISAILKAMGCDRIREDENDVHARCPMAPWLHERGVDKRPSFGVSINDRGHSKYNCFSCKIGGHDLKMLVWQWEELSGKKLPEEMWDWLFTTEILELDESEDDPFAPEACAPAHDTLPESFWTPFAGSVPRYLLNRGISLDTARTWGLGHDKARKRLMFPIRNENGELVGMMGRKTSSAVPGPKYVTLSGVKKGRYLYGENLIVRGDSVILVEGTMDVLHVWENGQPDVRGIFGSTLTKEQALTLVRWGKDVVFFLDNDIAGIKGTLKGIKLLEGRVPVWAVKYPEDKKEPTDFDASELMVVLGASVVAGSWVTDAEKRLEALRKAKAKGDGP